MPGGAAYDRETLRSVFNDAGTGKYRDGQAAGEITEGDHRDHVNFFIDGLMGREDFAPITVSGTDTYTASVYAYTLGNAARYGGVLLMKFTNANTGAATLQISSTAHAGTAYAIKKNVSEALVAGDIAAGGIYLLAYDGTNYQIVGQKTRDIVNGYVAEVTIPTASVLTANSSPVQIIAAPGANTVIVPTFFTISMDYAGTPYATNTSVRFLSGASIITSTHSGFLDASTDKVLVFPSIIVVGMPVNSAIYFTVATGDPTAGNSDLKVKIWYKVITI